MLRVCSIFLSLVWFFVLYESYFMYVSSYPIMHTRVYYNRILYYYYILLLVIYTSRIFIIITLLAYE